MNQGGRRSRAPTSQNNGIQIINQSMNSETKNVKTKSNLFAYMRCCQAPQKIWEILITSSQRNEL